MKRFAVVLTLANIAGFFIPGLQEFFGKTLPVPLGAIPLALILLWLFWIAHGEGKREIERLQRGLEQAKAKPASANTLQQAEPQWKTEYERFPEHGVMYVLEYPAERQDDLAVRIRVSDPRCLEHQAPMIQTPRTIYGLSSLRRVTFWRCAGRGREIANQENERLKVLARSNLIRRLSGIQPEAVAA